VGGVVRIQSGQKEPVEVIIVDSSSVRLTGLTDIKLQIRRISDGFLFDWSDDTFKASPVTKLQVMSEISAANSPGEYKLDKAGHVDGFDMATITNKVADDVYRLTLIQDPVASADNVPQTGEIKEGDFIDNLDDKISTLTKRLSIEMSFSYDLATDTLIGNVWVEKDNLVLTTVASVSATLFDDTGAAQFTMVDATPDAQGIFKLSRTPTGFVKNKSFYVVASVTLADTSVVKGAKGLFTVG